jgi:acetylornithine/N-succinyldiaminopimelate aminotransferase
MDGVQCGQFRTGRFQSFQRILEPSPDGGRFLPDGISMAKSLGGGFPIGAFWVRQPYADLLGPGAHATTFGGTPLASAVALKILEIIERDQLADHARTLGAWMKEELQALVSSLPGVLRSVRGLGLMIGLELADKSEIPAFRSHDRPASLQFVDRLHDAGVLTVPAGTGVVRLLPALNLTRADAERGLDIIARTARNLG